LADNWKQLLIIKYVKYSHRFVVFLCRVQLFSEQ